MKNLIFTVTKLKYNFFFKVEFKLKSSIFNKFLKKTLKKSLFLRDIFNLFVYISILGNLDYLEVLQVNMYIKK